MPEKIHQKRGPKTPQGLANSAQNSTTHSMTSARPLLSTESQADLDAHRHQWHLQYPTNNDIAHRLVTRAATSEWHLLRLERQFEAIASSLLATSVADWPASDHSLYQNIQRYLTTAQRAHHRDRLTIQQHRSEVRSDARFAEQQAPDPAQASNQALLQSVLDIKPPPSDMPLHQTIWVSADGNKQPHEWSEPSTSDILRQIEKAFETTRVIRTVNFRTRQAPPGYQWAQPQLDAAEPDSTGDRQVHIHLTAKSFRLAVERENGGPVQRWQDLDDLDRPILANKVKGPPCQPDESK